MSGFCSIICYVCVKWFQALMKFPPDYPYSPPSVKFLTKMWHPNVYEVSHAFDLLCVFVFGYLITQLYQHIYNNNYSSQL